MQGYKMSTYQGIQLESKRNTFVEGQYKRGRNEGDQKFLVIGVGVDRKH